MANEQRVRVNQEIRARKVRVVSSAGDNLGVMDTDKARHLARDENLDLIEISPNGDPPVVKIANLGKWRYEQQQREKNRVKTAQQVKELQLRPGVGEQDLQTKMRNAQKWLQKGMVVQVVVQFKGRQKAHPELGEQLVRRVVEELEPYSSLQGEMRKSDNWVRATLRPKV